MKGLWSLPGKVSDFGAGIAVFDGLVALGMCYCTYLSITRRPKGWPEVQVLHLGLVLLSIWFLLHWIDIVIHQSHARIAYGYILVPSLFTIIRLLSDILVLWGTWRVIIRYKHLRPSITSTRILSFPITTGLAGLLWFFGVYHLCLLFAQSVAWLSFSELNAINALAKGSSGFEVIFTVIQFLATLGTVIWTFKRYEECKKHNIYVEELQMMICAVIFLFLRSFCEVVIVGQLDRRPSNIREIARARDVTYGLFGIIFVGFTTKILPPKTAQDPLLLEEEMAVEAVKDCILSELETWTEQGRKTAPTISDLLQTVEQILSLQNVPEDPHHTLYIQLKEMDRLKTLYADWEPIEKGEKGSRSSEAGPSSRSIGLLNYDSSSATSQTKKSLGFKKRWESFINDIDKKFSGMVTGMGSQ